MRVLHVGKFYHPSLGGIETAIKTLADGLNARGVDVEVLCSNTGARRGRDTVGAVPVTRLPRYGSLFSQPLTPSLISRLPRLAREFDVVHVHVPNPLAELAALGIPAGTPLVLTYHADVVRQRWLGALRGPILRRLLMRADRVVATAEENIAHSPVLHEFASKCSVIPLGITKPECPDATAVESTAAALRARHGAYVLFVGRLVPYKGIEVLVRAAKDLGYPVLIVGDGPERARCEALARSMGTAAQVTFLGAVRDPVLSDALVRACRALALPSISRAEAFGLAAVEAMARGRPVVTSKLSTGIRSVNVDGVTGVEVAPGDPAALREGLLRLLEDHALADRMGTAARERFAAHFEASRMVEAHGRLYAQLRAGETAR